MNDAARARKLADRIAQIVAEMLERRVKDPRLGFVTVTDARITNDLREATVYYTVYGSAEEQAGTAVALATPLGAASARCPSRLPHGAPFVGPCGCFQRRSNWKRLTAFHVAKAHCDFLAMLSGLKRAGGTEVKSDAITTRFLTSMACSYGYSVNARILTVGFCMGCLDDRARSAPFRGVAALSTGIAPRRPRRNGVRCRGWRKATHHAAGIPDETW